MQKNKKRSLKKRIKLFSKNTNVLLLYSGGLLLITLSFSLYLIKGLTKHDTLIFSYDECIQSKKSIIIKTYPGQCKTEDKVTYIEKVIEPIDISNWTTFTDVQGFTFQCPQSWNCIKSKENAASIYQNHYLRISTFQLNAITPHNIQQSVLRHPRYNNPITWYKDVLDKKQTAIQAPISTRIYQQGTDGYLDPQYVNFDFSTMEGLELADEKKGVIFPASGADPDTSVLIPLNNSNLVLVLLSPGYLYKDPIIKTIVASIKPK